ncbi:MAG: ATP-binding cassette domain-containing protein, partial [Cyclobacteriaceae bacterium]|nr:ATP-binding cassette domain-containing protein [Cyclobacteriaceae bacterium]
QDNQTVLSDINFELEKGELAFIIGRTGSGKSSLLKTLYADLPLRLGEISIAGYNLTKLKSKDVPMLRRKLGIIFQDFQLFDDRTVSENLNFVMKATGWKDRAKMKKRLAEVLMQVGLGAVDTKMPHQLSGGEQQRVVIARAIINEPLLLIADEPTGNLDPEVSDGVFKLFLEINKSGTAILMATHDHTIIGNHPARILKCEHGKIKDSNLEQFELSSKL